MKSNPENFSDDLVQNFFLTSKMHQNLCWQGSAQTS